MGVSTRGGGGRAALAGAGLALRHAAWTAPLLVPLGVLQAVFVASPWLGSLEALRQFALVAPVADQRAQLLLERSLAGAGGLPGAAAACGLLVLAWLALMRVAGPLRATPPWALHEASHRAHALRLGAGLAGACACLIVQSGATRLNLVVDAVTSLRPTAAAALALLAVTQVLFFAGLGAVLGATLALARVALDPAGRAGACAVLAGVVALVAAAQLATREAVRERFDVGRSLAGLAGTAGVPERLNVAVAARDRAWAFELNGSIGGVHFSPEAAASVDAALEARGGWSMLAADAERFVIGERLVALQPEEARQRALRQVLRGAQAGTTHALLVSLGSAAPSPATRILLDQLESAEGLHFGAHARLLMASAHAQLGDRKRAQALAEGLLGDDERLLEETRSGAALVLNTLLTGRVSGRLLVGGRPHVGRIGLVSARDLFALPERRELPVTWLLRLVAAGPCDAEGRFELAGLPEGEMALVVLLPFPEGEGLRPRAPMPRIAPTLATPHVELGDLVLEREAGDEAPR